jgi:prepilin-type N-terminal cleavage/methylation domain-containing protein
MYFSSSGIRSWNLKTRSKFFVRNPSESKNRKSGFTLLEILIAVAILAIGVVGVVNLFPVGLQAASRASTFTRVGLLVQSAVEFYRSEGYEYIDDLYVDPPPDVETEEAEDIYDLDGNRHRFIRAPHTDADPWSGAGGMANSEPFSDNEDYRWRIVISEDVDQKYGGNDYHNSADIYKIILYIYWLDRGQGQFDFFEFHIAKHE